MAVPQGVEIVFASTVEARSHLHDWANEVQAGSYLLMDWHYERLGLPFDQAAFVDATVRSTNDDGYAVADAGLKCFGMDHGDPTVLGHRLFFLSDEHATFLWDGDRPTIGDRIRLVPGHIDPTVNLHDRYFVVRGGLIVQMDVWNDSAERILTRNGIDA